MTFKFSKEEKLKSRKVIERLFKERQSIPVFPLRLIYGKIDPPVSEFPAQFTVSISKRAFPKAVDRNRIKRIIREAYRLNKFFLYEEMRKKELPQYGLLFLYTGKEEPKFEEIEKGMKKVFKRFLQVK